MQGEQGLADAEQAMRDAEQSLGQGQGRQRRRRFRPRPRGTCSAAPRAWRSRCSRWARRRPARRGPAAGPGSARAGPADRAARDNDPLGRPTRNRDYSDGRVPGADRLRIRSGGRRARPAHPGGTAAQARRPERAREGLELLRSACCAGTEPRGSVRERSAGRERRPLCGGAGASTRTGGRDGRAAVRASRACRCRPWPTLPRGMAVDRVAEDRQPIAAAQWTRNWWGAPGDRPQLDPGAARAIAARTRQRVSDGSPAGSTFIHQLRGSSERRASGRSIAPDSPSGSPSTTAQ